MPCFEAGREGVLEFGGNIKQFTLAEINRDAQNEVSHVRRSLSHTTARESGLFLAWDSKTECRLAADHSDRQLERPLGFSVLCICEYEVRNSMRVAEEERRC